MAQVAAGRAIQQAPLSVRLQRVLGRDWTVGIPFVIPVIILCVGLIGYPVLFALYLSFTTKIAGRPEEWVGFQNYVSLWEDSNYRSAVWNTAMSEKTATARPIALRISTRSRSFTELHGSSNSHI